jgi:hypothetical protein
MLAIPEQPIGTLLSAKVRHSTGTSFECEPVGLALKKARIFHFCYSFQNIMIFSVLLGFLGDQALVLLSDHIAREQSRSTQAQAASRVRL